MIINTTADIVQKMAVKAIEASQPVGLGVFYYDPTHVFTTDMIEVTNIGIFLNYVKGRMVKFYAHQLNPTTWDFDDIITPDHQSWCRKYPTYQNLYDVVTKG